MRASECKGLWYGPRQLEQSSLYELLKLRHQIHFSDRAHTEEKKSLGVKSKLRTLEIRKKNGRESPNKIWEDGIKSINLSIFKQYFLRRNQKQEAEQIIRVVFKKSYL